MIYKVWIDIEEIDEENDHYQEQDLLFGAEKTFDNYEDAVAYATELHDANQRADQTAKFQQAYPNYHPIYRREVWVNQIQKGKTDLNYWEWVWEKANGGSESAK